jgi:hypothetical protein
VHCNLCSNSLEIIDTEANLRRTLGDTSVLLKIVDVGANCRGTLDIGPIYIRGPF